MRKHTMATPAGVPRSRAKTTRRERKLDRKIVRLMTHPVVRAALLERFGPPHVSLRTDEDRSRTKAMVAAELERRRQIKGANP